MAIYVNLLRYLVRMRLLDRVCITLLGAWVLFCFVGMGMGIKKES